MIYLDNAATTPILPQVKRKMEPFMSVNFGNPSASYELGRKAKRAMEESREQIAECIGAKESEIYFTSGGSEGDNWIIKGVADEKKKFGRNIITSRIEHHAVLNSCKYLEKMGYDITYLDVNKDGLISMEQLKEVISDNTTLVTVMYGNNEIGTLEPIMEIAGVLNEKGILFHSDAVQVIGQIPIDVNVINLDYLSASAHKFHGPKGVGFVYAREKRPIPSFINGGGQEYGKRAGTENVAGIIGMAEALKLSTDNMKYNRQHVIKLRNHMIERVENEIEEVMLNGDLNNRLPGNVNFSFKDIEGMELLILLEEEGIYASVGSACSAGSSSLSHVIKAIDVPMEYARGTIRFSLSSDNTINQIDVTVNILKKLIKILRNK